MQNSIIQLSSSEIKDIRNKILDIQGGKCAICNCEITEKTGISLDHQHRKKSSIIGEDGGGLVRGVLCRNCNILEGKIWNNMQRFFQFTKMDERINWLLNLIKYYEKENYNYIHPNEKPKEPKLSKRLFNKLKKLYSIKYPNRKSLQYPKSSKYTNKINELIEEFKVELNE